MRDGEQTPSPHWRRHDLLAVAPFDQAVGMLHFVDGLFPDNIGDDRVAPIFTHLRMNKVLIDPGELLAKNVIQHFDDFGVSLHGSS